jgi:hypothetical protein
MMPITRLRPSSIPENGSIFAFYSLFRVGWRILNAEASWRYFPLRREVPEVISLAAANVSAESKIATAQLRIRWDGDAPGVAEHRLSLAGFGHPLELLLAALRRIATQMVSTAVEAEHPKVGRFANLARQLDIEIVAIEGNSTGINAVVSFAHLPDELPLLMDLPDRATTELLECIEQESKGVARNWAVRKYLHTLPVGIHKQLYELHENGRTKKHVEIGDVNFTEMPPDMPSLVELEGNVVGVGFDPGRSEVRIKGDSSTFNLDATDEQVEAALGMRRAKIRALGVHDGSRARLLTVARASAPRFKVTPEAIEEQVFKRWAGVFARLAK